MVRSLVSSLTLRLFALALLAVSPRAFAQNHFPLELLNIKPVGVPPSGLDPDSRIYRAYPGLPYNIRAAVIGGVYPYTYALTNAPADMTIDANTGEITWTSPQANATPTITVTDAVGAQVSSTWPIAVATASFKFIDAVNGVNAANNGCSSNCGTGTATNPWRSIKDMGLNASPNDITYFKAGTYRVTDMARSGAGGLWEAVIFSDLSRSTIWLAHPGARPLIDFGFTGGAEWGPMITLSGNTAYVDGFETINSHIMAFQVGSTIQGPTFRKLRMHHHGPGVNGSNASMIMTIQNYPNAAYGMVVQDSELYDSPSDNILKIYSQNKMLIEGNSFHDTVTAMELKADVRQFTVRGNTMFNIRTNVYQAVAIGGNMHGISSTNAPTTGGEINFNLVRDSDQLALNLNQDGMAIPIYVYRNTFVGGVNVENTDAADGPFVFNNNVIVNNNAGTVAGTHVTLNNVSAPGRVVVNANNLTGYPSNNIVDVNGRLTAAYSQYVGTRGHQVVAGVGAGLPATPRNLRISGQ